MAAARCLSSAAADDLEASENPAVLVGTTGRCSLPNVLLAIEAAVLFPYVQPDIEAPPAGELAAGVDAPVGLVLALLNVLHLQVVAHRRLHQGLLAEGTGQLLGLGGFQEGGRREEVLGDRLGSGSGGLSRRRKGRSSSCCCRRRR